MFAYTTTGTEVLLDQMKLFDYTLETPSHPGFAQNLIANPGLFNRFSLPDPVLGWGNEFWGSDLDWDVGIYENGRIGSTKQVSSLYQHVEVKPGATYTLVGQYGDKGKNVPAGFGIDFFDASWNPVAKTSVDLYGVETFNNLSRRVVVPANAKHATVWIWCDKLPPDGSGGLKMYLNLFEQEAVATSNTTIVPFNIDGVPFVSWSIGLFLSDADGINLASIDLQDAYFTSKSNPTKTYPVSSVKKISSDGDKSVLVTYSIPEANYQDVSGIVLRSRQIKDKKGNFAPARTIKFTFTTGF